MEININHLNYNELRSLNEKVVERMRVLSQRKSQELMHKFDLGDQVCFKDKYGRTVVGKIIRFNQKSISIDSDDGVNWRVHPSFLNKVIEAKTEEVDLFKQLEVAQEMINSNIPSRNRLCPCCSGKKYKRCCAYS